MRRVEDAVGRVYLFTQAEIEMGISRARRLDYHECRAEGCSNTFRPIDRSEHRGSPQGRLAVYCCDKCQSRQTRRNQRARLKARIQDAQDIEG